MGLLEFVFYVGCAGAVVMVTGLYSVALGVAEEGNYDCPSCGRHGMMRTASRKCDLCGHQG